MRVVVGSTNPVKMGAVAAVFKQFFPEAEVAGREVKSNVAEQPRSEKETVTGAENRAKAALKSEDEALYGVGIEGGYTDKDGHPMECAWVAIAHRDGRMGLGGGLYFELPPKVAERIKAGEELGPIMDHLTGTENVKQKMGAIGIFTRGKLTRQAAYEQLVMQALVKFVSPEWF